MQTANLAYIDPMKRTVSCRLCVDTERTVRRIFLDSHLRIKHNVTKEEEVEIIKSLDATTHTASGERLATGGIGLEQEQEQEQDISADNEASVANDEAASSCSAQRTLPIGKLLECPMQNCSQEFVRKYTCVRHLKTTHKLAADIVKNYAALLPSVMSECKNCGKCLATLALQTTKTSTAKGC